MIMVSISPEGVEEILLAGQSDKEEDACLAIWPIVRNRLKALDFDLRAEAVRSKKNAETEDPRDDRSSLN